MPTMPNADQAHIDPAKLHAYLLNPAHEDGGPKADFLAAIGFDLADAAAVEVALLAHGRSNEATVRRTAFGVVYEVDGPVVSPIGRIARIRTVWQVDIGADAPRLVTMKPIKAGSP